HLDLGVVGERLPLAFEALVAAATGQQHRGAQRRSRQPHRTRHRHDSTHFEELRSPEMYTDSPTPPVSGPPLPRGRTGGEGRAGRSDEGAAGAEPRRPRGRPAGDRTAKRAELLKAAASVIAQEGYTGASLRKVAQRAGCTTGAVTYYFANKRELVVALAESR